jgi:glycosyltransferase involved in cell wall biosynthesis
MRKKILFLIPNLKHGGAEKVLVNLVNHLDRGKYEITVRTLFDVGVHKKTLEPHITYRSVWKKVFRGNSYLIRCFSPTFWWKRFVKEHYDIAVSYLEGPTTRILSGCSDENTKCIAWLHIELNTSQLAAQGFRSVSEAKRAYERFDRVIAVSQNVKTCFVESLDVRRPIEILYNTNETKKIQQMARLPVQEERFQTGDVITVCSVAKLMKTKGFDRLLEVHKRLLDECMPHRIYILGIGEEQQYLEHKIKEYGVESSFVLLGFRENPYQYVANCDLYVCSSRREGFSTAVTEALIVGTPVVSTDCSGAKELLGEHDEFGLVVENSAEGIYQGMKKMLTDSELCAHYKEQAKIRGSFFSTEKTVKAVEEMLDGL